MYVCMYWYVCACVHIYVINKCACVYSVSARVRARVCVSECIYVCDVFYVCVCACIYIICMCVCVCMYVRACIYT